jgi:phosphoribosylamine--glycine ligase
MLNAFSVNENKVEAVMKKVLVIGSGGREHAILWALKQTSRVPVELYCAPGNAGIAQIATCVPLPTGDFSLLVDFARSKAIDLTVVGPEVPLAAGIVDEFQRHDLAIVGPTQAAAQLEASKAFAKNFMKGHRIPTADYIVANSAAEALNVLRSERFGSSDSPIVIKADGLAAGKGVVLAPSRAQAEEAVAELTSGTLVSPDASKQIVIEEMLEGPEVSVLVFADGRDYAVMPPARDHKRVGENDTGPNTGGMGAITGSAILDEGTLDHILREVVEPTLKGAAEEGFPFQGVLFVGLMLTTDGPKVLEYNVRFGDPETQAILVRLKSDLLQIFLAITQGSLAQIGIEWSEDSSACVVLASEGYPGPYKTGIPIQGLDQVEDQNVHVFHAGTSIGADGKFLTNGGRVLGLTATGANLNDALASCYSAAAKIKWAGMQYRRDIGHFKTKSRATVSDAS